MLFRSEGDWSAGFDTVDDLAELPAGWTGGIWTNRVDIIAPRIG